MDVLSALPFDVACDVLACGVLSPADVAGLARVSRAWHALVRAEPVWYGIARRSRLPASPHNETGAFGSVRSWRMRVALHHALARQWGTGLARNARAPVPLPTVRHVISLYGPQQPAPAPLLPAAIDNDDDDDDDTDADGPSADLVATFRDNIARNRLQRRIIPLPRHQALLVPGVQGDAWVVDTHSQELLWGAPHPPPPTEGLPGDALALGGAGPVPVPVPGSVPGPGPGPGAEQATPLTASVDSDGDQFILSAHVWGLDTCQVDVFRAHPASEVRGHFVHVGELPMPLGIEQGYKTMLKVHTASAAILAGGRTFVQWDLDRMACTHVIPLSDFFPGNVGTAMPITFDYDDQYIYISTRHIPSARQGWPPASWDDLYVIRRPQRPNEKAKWIWSLNDITASGPLVGPDPKFIWTTHFNDCPAPPRIAPEARILRGPPVGPMTPLDTVFQRDATTDAILVATGRGLLIIRGCTQLFGKIQPDANEKQAASPTSPTSPTSPSSSPPSSSEPAPLVALLDFGSDDESNGVPAHWPGSGYAQLSLCQGRGLYVSPTGRTLLVDYQKAQEPDQVRVVDMSAAKRPSAGSPTIPVPFAPISACPPPSAPTPLPAAPVPSGRTTGPPTPGPSSAALALALTQRVPSGSALSRKPSFASTPRRNSRPLSRRPSGLAPAPLAALRSMAVDQAKEREDPRPKERKVRKSSHAQGADTGQAAATALSLTLYRSAQDRMLQRLYGALPGRPCAAVALTPHAVYLLSVRVDGHPARHAIVQAWDIASSALVAVDATAAARTLSARTVLSPMDVDGGPARTPVRSTARPTHEPQVAAQDQTRRMPGQETPILLGA